MITIIDETVFKPHCFVNNFPIYKVASALYFKKENKLFLFRPIYHPCLPTDIAEQLLVLPKINVSDTLQCIHMKTYTSHLCYTSHINEYKIIGICNDILTITIDDTEYEIFAIDSIIPNNFNILQCTLFKYDYKNIKNHVDYYFNYHGIKNYLLYYNNVITDSLKELLKNMPSECNIYIFSNTHAWSQTFCGLNDHRKYWSHVAHSLQLTHSAIIANFCSDWLMAIDFDEYIDTDIRIDSFIEQNPDLDGIKIELIHKTCSGRLCYLDYDYNYTEILKNLDIIKISAPKYIEKTRGLCRYQRLIHKSFYKWKTEKKINGSHIQCLSWFNESKKRFCVPLKTFNEDIIV